jgi:hypothetical protein
MVTIVNRVGGLALRCPTRYASFNVPGVVYRAAVARINATQPLAQVENQPWLWGLCPTSAATS